MGIVLGSSPVDFRSHSETSLGTSAGSGVGLDTSTGAVEYASAETVALAPSGIGPAIDLSLVRLLSEVIVRGKPVPT
ncbi:hypothetical protein BT63DRAFT_458167 [Microthyrium microscopicum]|uniref:Uncharacterized protein n=1 Tax=Microthyrium microscopicum TaxID=703497 RepID=A0A6A6U4Y8_9PEZI|nr:hypothetical protein BT63DRAFT_458167 [Microthyrium microscopicum]